MSVNLKNKYGLIIVEAGLEQICETCGIKLRRVKRLSGLEEFKAGMMRFR